jgi:hypothetical protein
LLLDIQECALSSFAKLFLDFDLTHRRLSKDRQTWTHSAQ